MSRTKYLAALALVAAVSTVFGMLLASGPFAPTEKHAPAVWSPAMAAVPPPPEISLGSPVASFADVADRANPAVVSISNVEFRRGGRDSDPDMPFEDPFRFFFGPRQKPRGGVPGDTEGEEDEQRLESGGSGFVISEDGYILTNNHVVANASKLQVTMQSGEKLDAKLVGKDESIDLALLKVTPSAPLMTLALGDSDALRVGEWVIAIGNPLGYEHTVTVGVVSGMGRQLQQLGDVDSGLANFIQTDAAINFGNSGGPLLNARGEVVGINTAITRNAGPYHGMIQGIGFALPINQARAVLDQLKQSGKVSRGYLGVSISPITETKRKAYGLPSTQGAFIEDVQPGLPGAEAGLHPGDAVTSVNGQPIKDTAELIRLVSSRRPGENVTLGVLRDGKDVKLKVRLADRSAELRAANDTEETEGGGGGGETDGGIADRLGFRAENITPEVSRQAKLPRDFKGVWVATVRPSSNAFEEGLRQGAFITKVNNEDVTNIRQLRDALAHVRAGEYVRLYVVRPDGEGGLRGNFVIFPMEK